MIKKCNNIEDNNFVDDALGRRIDVFNKIKKNKIFQDQIMKAAKKLIRIYKNKGKLLFCKNS